MTPKIRCTLSKKRFDAVIFDLDGVVTQSAKVHAKAWKEMFDDFLKEHSKQTGKSFEPFDLEKDYPAYLDGKPRYEGVKSFLQSREIELPFGAIDDPPGMQSICGLGNQKNDLFITFLNREGIEVYQTSVELIRNLRDIKMKLAIVSSSKNCTTILKSAGIEALFEVQVDGIVSEELKLKGKPEPDIFTYAAEQLHVSAEKAVIVEDSLAGVQAGSKGGFGCVIGVDRAHQADNLLQHGADFVVSDLSEVQWIE